MSEIMRPTLIVSEVRAGRTEGSERMITEIAEQLTASGEAVLHTVAPVKRLRWMEAWRGGKSRYLTDTPVVHFYPIGSMTLGGLLRAWLWRRAFPDAGFVFHAFQMPVTSLPRRSTIRRALGARALVLTPSAELADKLQSAVPVRRVPPTVDTRAFRPPRPEERVAARRGLGISDSAFVVLHAGHIRVNRNLEVLGELVAHGCHTILIVSPRFEPDPALSSHLAASGVEMVAGAQDMTRWYWAADCYVFPVVRSSGAVGLPLSVLEALACGLPVVSTRFDGLHAALGEKWPGMHWASAAEIPAAVDQLRVAATVDPGAISEAVSSRFGFTPVLELYRQAYRMIALP